MVTPLQADSCGIDEQKTRQLVEHLITNGVAGLFILGTNGEFYALSTEEKITLAKIVVEQAAGRVPVFAGAGGISTQAVSDLANEFAKVGVDAVSIITPFLIKISDRELINHYQEIAEKNQLPIILYNIPSNTGINISEAAFKELVKNPKIIGIKDSSGNVENIKMYIENSRQRADFSVLVGSDSKILTALKLGADGAVAATSNVLTKTDVAIYDLYQSGDLTKAQVLQASIDEFRRVLKFATVPAVLKYSCDLIGYPVGKTKLPVLPAEGKYVAEIKEVLTTYGTIEGFEVQ
ncbi:dihydrodipicolinate synthase [Enterococcus devriesei]|uniref:Dihydrodipicolinate synthase n=2 Tax=Enterococcus devriesei TaxID=319970 RepID=A0A1L8SM49_9ENTE|nr:dihydrodipicolinate synthase [Enterococcus devriesei]